MPEPNNLDYPPEKCAGANFTEAYGPLNAWGWADANCSVAAPFMCKLLNPRGIFRCFDNGTYTGNRYCLNTTKSSFAEAQSGCNLIGGHLVAYQDMTEQRCAAPTGCQLQAPCPPPPPPAPQSHGGQG